MFHMRESKQTGFSLVELGIVLALVGIGLFVAISKITEYGDSNRAQTLSRDLTQIISNFQQLYADQAQFPQENRRVNNLLLIRNNVYPASWVKGGDVIGPFGGEPRIDVQAWGGRTVAAVIVPNVPSRICTQLGQLMSGAMGFAILNGGERSVKSPRSENSVLDLNRLGRLCTAVPNVSIAVYFGRS